MNQVAFILADTTLYWYPVIVALSVLTGICIFMACCAYVQIRPLHAAATVLVSLVLSAVLSRLVYWYCRPDSFGSWAQALTTPAAGKMALAGVFAGCGLAVLLLAKPFGETGKLLECLSIAGCAAIGLGRLGNFFTSADRGQIVVEMISLPWSYPVLNTTSGVEEYRLATFMFQAVIAGVLFAVLAVLFFWPRARKHVPQGDICLLFLMVYCASQILLDSTRYDSLYLRSNGFVSMVQVVSAVVLAGCILVVAVRAVKTRGLQKWMFLYWAAFAGLFGLAGYMEYYVQRHGKLAFFSYDVMEHCLVIITVLGILLWRKSIKKAE